MGPEGMDTLGSTTRRGRESQTSPLRHMWPSYCFSILGPPFTHLQNGLMILSVGLKELL